MSLARSGAAAIGLAVVVVVVAVWWRSQRAAPQSAQPGTRADQLAAAASAARVSSAPGASSRAAAPALAAEPFAGRELAITADGPDAPVVALRSSALSGRALSIELAVREPVAEGKQVFATVSVSDALGNTVMDCTWRDVQLGDDARTLDCELPDGLELPLTISGHQRSAPSFIEAPTVVAVDNGVHP